jgi:predicted ABC-type ATPase
MRKAGYQIEMVFLRLADPDISIKRVAHRVKQGGHYVPDEDVRRRFAR